MRRGPGLAAVWLAAVWLVVVLAAGCTRPPPGITAPDVRLMRVETVPAESPRVQVEMLLQNYNEVGLHIAGYRFALSLDGVAFANGTSSERIWLPRFGQALVMAEVGALDPRIHQLLDTPGATAGFDYQIRGTFFREVEGASARIPLRFQKTGRLLGTGTGY